MSLGARWQFHSLFVQENFQLGQSPAAMRNIVLDFALHLGVRSFKAIRLEDGVPAEVVGASGLHYGALEIKFGKRKAATDESVHN